MITNESAETSASLSSAEFKALVEQANAGDPTTLKQLKHLLDENPHIWQRVGDMAKHAEMLLIQLVAAGDQLLVESLQRKLDDLKAQLGGSNPSPLEQLATERVATCWLQLQHIDALVTKARSGTVEATFLLKRQGQADRAYNAALKGLTTVRQLLPAKVDQRDATDVGSEKTPAARGQVAASGESTREVATLPMNDARGRRRA